MKKKILSVLLAGVFACAVMGCGADGTDGGGSGADSPDTDNSDGDNSGGDGEADAAGESDAAEDEGQAVSDTVLWFNGTWAVLSSLNQFDYTTYPGVEINDTNQVLEQESLKQSWDVTDTESARETIAWLLDEGGHREDFREEMEYLEECGITDAAGDGNYKDWMLENFDLGSDDAEGRAQIYADSYAFYLEHPETGIAAWDYSRAMSLCAFYNLAGYYTGEEALDKSMEIAELVQEEFTSWDEFYESYFAGYEYWAEESSEDRRAIYEDIKTDDHSPFRLDWNLAFEKTW